MGVLFNIFNNIGMDKGTIVIDTSKVLKDND